ncbi:MAG: lipocalin-like domain-containing protein [Patescibacteria group bacterium]
MMTGRKILKGALTQLPIELYELMVRSASRRPLPPIAFTGRDHFPHRGTHVEWWYFTSVLTTPKRKAPVGLEVTFFRVRTLVDSVIVHAAVTDVESQKFSYTGMVLPVYIPFTPDAQTVIALFGNRVGFNEDTSSLVIGTRFRGLQVYCSCAVRDVMAQGAGGVLEMQNSPGDASYYFTLPNMKTEGTIVLKGESLPVTGLTWHDHQWGSFNVVNLKWDWFSLRFDGDDLYVMLFNFDRWGTTYGTGNVERHGRTMRVERFEVRASDVCRAGNGITYPIDWEIRIFESAEAASPFIIARVKPVLKEQYLSSSITPDYWEGLCTVHAEVLTQVDLDGARFLDRKVLDGFAYVEMTGYER